MMVPMPRCCKNFTGETDMPVGFFDGGIDRRFTVCKGCYENILAPTLRESSIWRYMPENGPCNLPPSMFSITVADKRAIVMMIDQETNYPVLHWNKTFFLPHGHASALWAYAKDPRHLIGISEVAGDSRCVSSGVCKKELKTRSAAISEYTGCHRVHVHMFGDSRNELKVEDHPLESTAYGHTVLQGHLYTVPYLSYAYLDFTISRFTPSKLQRGKELVKPLEAMKKMIEEILVFQKILQEAGKEDLIEKSVPSAFRPASVGHDKKGLEVYHMSLKFHVERLGSCTEKV